MPRITPTLSFGDPTGTLLCAGLAGGIVAGAGLVVLVADLLRAPEGYEDEAGFHVIRGKKRKAKKNG